MTTPEILYFCVDPAAALSGGVRKIGDHIEILKAHGFNARVSGPAVSLLRNDYGTFDHYLAICQEVNGDAMRDGLPAGLRRVSFVQNGYLIDMGVSDPVHNHPFMTTPDLVAIMTSDAHAEDIIRGRFPDLPVPMIRTHSSGNGRMGKPGPFSYGPWPRKKQIAYFRYKWDGDSWPYVDFLTPLLTNLPLPDDWELVCMTGMSDEEIAETMRTVAIFLAPNHQEGMCAPTSEAMISGAVIVCWTGGGTDEYLIGRSVIAPQDDVDKLRECLIAQCYDMEARPEVWAEGTRKWSDWFQAYYNRQVEVEEIVAIMSRLVRSAPAGV
jgi:hypothetical protein